MINNDLAIWLYGSYARSDADALSDIDIFVVSDYEISLKELMTNILCPFKDCSLSEYKWAEVEKMAEYGSLFLQHLRNEGSKIWESDSVKGKLTNILSNMGKYKNVQKDIRGFRTVFNDVRESLIDGGSTIFELSVLATIIRHSSILGCWISGCPSFGRVEPVIQFVKIYGLDPKIGDEFYEFYKYRMYIENRTSSVPEPLHHLPDMWLQRTNTILGKLEGTYNVS